MNDAQYQRLVAARANGRNPDDRDDLPAGDPVIAAALKAASGAVRDANELMIAQRAEIDRQRIEISRLRARVAELES